MTTKAAETPAQSRCPYCHRNGIGDVEDVRMINAWLAIDPESSELISQEVWDYYNDRLSNNSRSVHINYCYMCGRRLDGE